MSEREVDILIVGGGIVGLGALLDATSRGLRVALVEQDDIAVGTSSRSSRLTKPFVSPADWATWSRVRPRSLRAVRSLVPMSTVGRAWSGTASRVLLLMSPVVSQRRAPVRRRHR